MLAATILFRSPQRHILVKFFGHELAFTCVYVFTYIQLLFIMQSADVSSDPHVCKYRSDPAKTPSHFLQIYGCNSNVSYHSLYFLFTEKRVWEKLLGSECKIPPGLTICYFYYSISLQMIAQIDLYTLWIIVLYM